MMKTEKRKRRKSGLTTLTQPWKEEEGTKKERNDENERKKEKKRRNREKKKERIGSKTLKSQGRHKTCRVPEQLFAYKTKFGRGMKKR